ncbi:MAG: NAD(P)/FAD-dependent oxidoreductase, partial [Bacteroidota bacterium]
EKHFFWKHPKLNKSIRLVYAIDDSRLLGVNLMGIRYRQNVCQKWIEGKTHIEDVLPNLGAANFDPEFFKEYEADIIAKYNQENGTNIQLKRKRGWKNVLAVLQN